jgi:hypothetical protein
LNKLSFGKTPFYLLQILEALDLYRSRRSSRTTASARSNRDKYRQLGWPHQQRKTYRDESSLGEHRRCKVMITQRSYRGGLSGILLLATVAATFGVPGPSRSTTVAEATGSKLVTQPEHALALQLVAHRLQGEPQDGRLRVSSLGSGHPVMLSRLLLLKYDEANRIAGWIASLQKDVHYRMSDTIDTMLLVDVTQAEAALWPLAFAIDQRWFAVEYVDLRYFGRMAMSKPDAVRSLVVQAACRFMSRVTATPSDSGTCDDGPKEAVVIARR